MATWPVSLPQMPLYNGLSVQPEKNRVDFWTDVGPGKRRRRSTARSQIMPVKFNMTEAQRAVFKAFYEDDTADGSLPFTWTDPFEDESASFYFETEPVTVPLAADVYEVSFQVRRFP
jgi:hypothetical protein